jgi:hypothetical protein
MIHVVAQARRIVNCISSSDDTTSCTSFACCFQMAHMRLQHRQVMYMRLQRQGTLQALPVHECCLLHEVFCWLSLIGQWQRIERQQMVLLYNMIERLPTFASLFWRGTVQQHMLSSCQAKLLSSWSDELSCWTKVTIFRFDIYTTRACMLCQQLQGSRAAPTWNLNNECTVESL